MNEDLINAIFWLIGVLLLGVVIAGVTIGVAFLVHVGWNAAA